MKALLLAAALFAAAAPAAAVNLVTNGNFSAGNTGFTSQYQYRAPGNYGGALAEGLYAIDTNAINTHPAWTSLADNTGDAAGLYFIANGAGDDSLVWQQTITVKAGYRYEFSAFAANLCCNANQAPPNFSELILMADAGQGFVDVAPFTLSGTGVWESISGEFINGQNTSLTLRIINTNTVAGGNDFAIDDIAFGAVPEPATWGLMLIGFGMVGVAARRRSTAVTA